MILLNRGNSRAKKAKDTSSMAETSYIFEKLSKQAVITSNPGLQTPPFNFKCLNSEKNAKLRLICGYDQTDGFVWKLFYPKSALTTNLLYRSF